MKNENKIKLLKNIKNRIIPSVLALGIGFGASGCRRTLDSQYNVGLDDTGNDEFMQSLYSDSDILNKYDYIGTKSVKFAKSDKSDKDVVMVGKCNKDNKDEYSYGFIDNEFNEIIPVGKYDEIDVFYSSYSDINLIKVYKDDLFAYLDRETLKEIIPLDDWKDVELVGINIIKATRKDGSYVIYNYKNKEKFD